jgi:hypothetical protein
MKDEVVKLNINAGATLEEGLEESTFAADICVNWRVLDGRGAADPQGVGEAASATSAISGSAAGWPGCIANIILYRAP